MLNYANDVNHIYHKKRLIKSMKEMVTTTLNLYNNLI